MGNDRQLPKLDIDTLVAWWEARDINDVSFFSSLVSILDDLGVDEAMSKIPDLLIPQIQEWTRALCKSHRAGQELIDPFTDEHSITAICAWLDRHSGSEGEPSLIRANKGSLG
ncbi:MAG: hypothetical protein HC927_12810 [Deltaproteobacteria bacterium]|nr:hypothetical protein [Deltaproteobacteria bacterium]